MSRAKKIIVPEDEALTRLDACVAKHDTAYSRSIWQKLIVDEHILVNGEAKTIKYKVKTDDIVIIKPYEKLAVPELEVMYEDDDVIVINKPAGLITHLKSNLESEPSIASFIRDKTTAEGGNRAGIVHRLDRATSGVIIAAKTEEARSHLANQFAIRNVKKWYISVVDGQVEEDNFEIDQPIGRSRNIPSTFRIDQYGKPAKTTVWVANRGNKTSTLLLKPHTGRTHQLRVHLKYLGHPIIGDPVYGPPPNKHQATNHNLPATNHMLLHAWQLEITLPSSKRMNFVADPPEYMTEYMDEPTTNRAETFITSFNHIQPKEG